MRLLLIPLLQFDGIIHNNETSEFLVHLSWYVGSFSWEYPNAPEGIPTVGFTSTGPRFSSDILNDLHDVATQLHLPRSDWDCPQPSSSAPSCDNMFFEAWRTFYSIRGFSVGGGVTWIMLVSAVLLTALALAQEWMIRKRPYWMRCRCIVLKRYCLCPKGTKEEIEQLDDFVWDKIRLAYWACVSVYFLAPAAQVKFTSVFFLKFLNYIDRRLPEGISMNPRANETPVRMLWVAFAASMLGTMCMLVKWRMSRRPKGWMENQSLGQLQDPLLDEDGELGHASRGEETGRYTD